MPDFAVADPEEGLREQGNPSPVTPSSLGQRFMSGAATALTGSFTDLEQWYARQDTGNLYSEPKSDAAAINARYPDLKVKESLPMSVAQNMNEAQQARVKQQNLAARYPSGFGNAALGLGADALSGLLDPVGDAAFMIPVIGETRYAAWLARAGESAGLAGRAAVTLGVGAARGEAGQAILSAGKLGLSETGIGDYHLGDAAHDLLFAPVAGAVLHGALAFRGDILGSRFAEPQALPPEFSDPIIRRFVTSPEGQMAASNAAVHDAALRAGAAQLASGAPFDVRPVFDAAKYRRELMGGTAVEAPGLDTEAHARADNALARAAGEPSHEEVRWQDDARAARAAPDGLAVSDGQIAEARAAVDQMRAAGHLTAEDEALLAELERPPSAATSPEQAAWHLAADKGGVPRTVDAIPEEVLATAISREARAPADPEEFRGRAEGWIDERISQIAPDLVEEFRKQEISHESSPEKSGTPSAAAEGGGGPESGDTGATGAKSNGEGAGSGGESATGTDRQSDVASGKPRSGTGRIAASGEQEPADLDVFTPPKRGEADAMHVPYGWGDVEGGVTTTRYPIAKSPKFKMPFGELSEGEAALKLRIEEIAHELAPSARVEGVRKLRVGSPEGTAAYGMVTGDGERRMIVWSLEAPDAARTLRHEVVHYLRHSGLFSDKEWSALEKAAKTEKWEDEYGIAQRYGTEKAETQLEESIAEKFADWQSGRAQPSGPLATIWNRLKDFVSRVAAAVKQMFGADTTADDVFRRIETGEIGRRTQPASPERYGATAFQMTPEQSARAEQMDAAVAARQKLTAYQDLQKRMALIQAVANFHDQTVNRPTLRHPLAGIDRKLPLATSIDALTRGISEAVKGARESTASEQLARANDFLGGLQTGLDKIPGGMEAWRKAALTKEWVRELHELNKKDGKPGVSKSPMALDIARAVKQAQDVAKMRLNQSGAWIGEYDGYISRTQHNAVKIDQAGYQAWKTFTLDRLDEGRTFADLNPGSDADTFGSNGSDEQRAAEIDRFLKGTWDGLSTGVHMSSQQGVGKGAAFSGPGSLGKKLSSERVLHWKSADAWREYQEKFGDPVIERGIMNGLHRAAHDAALMRRWGSNPQYTFDNLLRTIKEQYRDDHEAIRAFQGAEARLREEFAFLSGAASMPGTKLAWQIRSGILGWQDITKLGNVLFAHFSAAVTKPHQMMYHGVGRWQSYSSVIRNLVQDGSVEGRQTLENLRANAAGLTQDIVTGYEPIDGVPGRISGLRMKMMRLGGLPWLLSRQKTGTEWELANFLGQRLGSEFEGLNPRTQRALKIYGLDKAEWDTLRSAPDHDTDAQGLPYLTPQAAQRATDAAIDALAGQRINPGMGNTDIARVREETRDRLMMKLAGYYTDSADRSTVTPGIPERAMFTRIGGRFGGPIIGQYKTWAAAAVRQLWGQSLYGSSRGEAVKALAGLVATGTAVGYLRMVAKDVAGGRNPRMLNGDPENDAEIILSAMVQGGGLGILGDMILGQFEANAGSGRERAAKYIATLAGPAIGDVVDVLGVGFDYANAPFDQHPGKAFQRANANALHQLTAHLPAVNLFYLRTLFNYLIFDRLYEMASPGYNKRYMERVKKQSAGQTFFAPPTSYLGHDTYPVH